MPFTIVVAGDRNYTNYNYILDTLTKWKREKQDETMILIHGGCKGADKLAAQVAQELKFDQIIDEPADWENYGRAAGPIRNRLMINKYKPDVILGFHDHIKNSRGTVDTLNYGLKNGYKVYLNNQIYSPI